MFGVPALYRVLLDGIKRAGLERAADGIRCVVNGAAAMTEDLLGDLRAVFKNAGICLTYGLSEASPLVTALPDRLVAAKGCSIGLPVEPVELKLLTDDVRYWMPLHRNFAFGSWEEERTQQGRDLNWFDEGRFELEQRVKQIGNSVPVKTSKALCREALCI